MTMMPEWNSGIAGQVVSLIISLMDANTNFSTLVSTKITLVVAKIPLLNMNSHLG